MKKLLLVLALGINLVSSAHAVSEKVAREFCADWFPALVLGEKEVVSTVGSLLNKFYTKEATLIDPNYKLAQVGHSALGAYYEIVLAKYPNWSFTIEEITPRDGGFILHYLGNAPGVVEEFRGVDIIDLVKVEGEYKISKLIGVYDRTPFIEASQEE